MRKILLLFISLFCLLSCRTVQQVDSSYTIDTIYISKKDTFKYIQKDSFIKFDSIFVKEWVKNDTVYIEKNKIQLVKGVSNKHQEKSKENDSVKVQIKYKYITKTVIKKQSFFESVNDVIDKVIIGFIIFCLLMLFVRYKDLIIYHIKRLF